MPQKMVAWDMEAEGNVPEGRGNEGDIGCVWGPWVSDMLGT